MENVDEFLGSKANHGRQAAFAFCVDRMMMLMMMMTRMEKQVEYHVEALVM